MVFVKDSSSGFFLRCVSNGAVPSFSTHSHGWPLVKPRGLPLLHEYYYIVLHLSWLIHYIFSRG